MTTGLPAAIRFSNRPDVLARAISNSPATGKTALYDAVIEALDRLRTGTRNKKALIVISDGGDNASAHSLRQMLNKAGQSSALVYTIGVFDEEDPDRNPGVLRRLARATGGESFLPGRLSEVVTVCEGIARDIRNQYTLAYVSTNASQSGAWRTIRVVVHSASKQRLSVRTRNGYIAAGGSKPADADGAP